MFIQSVPLWINAIAGVMMTAFYMFRLFFLTFKGKFRGSEEQKQHLHDSPQVMMIPLMILTVLSLFGGVINLPAFMGGSTWLHCFLAPVFAGSVSVMKASAETPGHLVEWLLAGFSLVCVVIMIVIAWFRFLKKEPETREAVVQKSFLPRLLSHKYYINELYDTLFVKPLLSFSKVFHEVIEKGIIDRFVNWIGALVIRAGNTIRYLQNGHVGFYVFMMVAGIIAILFFNLVL